MSYTPSQEILASYGEVMVNYGLGNGAGIKPGDVVGLGCAEAPSRCCWRSPRRSGVPAVT
jgi:hypothetical protein